MPYLHRLSARLAASHAAVASRTTAFAFLVLAVAACGGDRLNGPSDPSRHLASITVAPDPLTLGVNGTQQLSVTLRDAGDHVITGPAVSWSSDDSSIVTVSSSGLVSAVAPGQAHIIARAEGQVSSILVLVTPTGPTAPVGPTVPPGYYASPSGSSANDGSYARPWDLATALAGGHGRIRPGTTLWLRGGTYRGAFVSTLTGTAGSPITVRQYPGERAVVDGPAGAVSIWRVNGEYSVFWGFEITKSDPARSTSSTGNHFRGNSVVNYASHTKYINLVVRDGGVAFYNEPSYADVEITGCIVYNNGWQGPDRGHGHALYLKSASGPILVRDNVIFNQFGFGIHSYSDAGSGQLRNQRFEGNVSFNNGTLSSNSTSANILVGGEDYTTGEVLVGNMTYFSPGAGGKNVHVGLGALQNGTIELRDNYIAGGAPVLQVGYWSTARFTGNTLIGSSSMVYLTNPSTTGLSWSGGMFNRDPLATAWIYRETSYAFAAWVEATGLSSQGSALPGLPQATKVVVRANPYERGRGTIVVYNWSQQGSVSLDLSRVLSSGDRYEIRNVQSLFGAPVVSGTYTGGAVLLPLVAVNPPVPVGLSSSRAPRTGTAFNVYIVTIR